MLIPVELGPLCAAAGIQDWAAGEASLSYEDRKQRGERVVRAVTRGRDDLSSEVLATSMPAPDAVLKLYGLEDRTRTALERRRSSLVHVTHWTVERYLRIPGFGIHCLVDLLAARQEAAAADVQPAASSSATRKFAAADRRPSVAEAARIRAISELLVRRAPFASRDLGPWLVEEGLADHPLSLRELCALYRRNDVALPIQIARYRHVEVVVPLGTVGVAREIVACAVRFVSNWGLAAVDVIGSRVRALRATPVARQLVARVIVALPNLLWLDEGSGWFTLRGARNRLGLALRQAFAVTDRIRLEDLTRVLAQQKTRLHNLPEHLFPRFLRAACDCEVVDGWVRPGGLLPATVLPAAARTAGRSIDVAALAALLEQPPLFPRAAANRLRALQPAPLLSAG